MCWIACWRESRRRKAPGLEPIKINAVIVRGHNEDEVADFAAFAREHDVKMRFIEFMPLDSGHDWSREDVVSGREIRERISERFPLIPIDVARGSETLHVTVLPTAHPARLASSPRSRNLSAAPVRAFALPLTARFAPAFSRPSNILCAMWFAPARRAPRLSTSSKVS